MDFLQNQLCNCLKLLLAFWYFSPCLPWKVEKEMQVIIKDGLKKIE